MTSIGSMKMDRETKKVWAVSIGSFIIIALLFLVIKPIRFSEYYTMSPGEVSLIYQDGHKNETVNYNKYVFYDLAEFLHFENLNDSSCYWIGYSYRRDASIHFTKEITYENSSVIIIQWTRDLNSMFLARGDFIHRLEFVLVLSVEW